MSPLDLCQLYCNRCVDDNSFGIVISPRQEGVKLLCVHLTDDGFRRMSVWYRQTGGNFSNFKSYVSTRLSHSFIPLYCQVPFRVAPVPTIIADLHTTKELVDDVKKLHPFRSCRQFREPSEKKSMVSVGYGTVQRNRRKVRAEMFVPLKVYREYNQLHRDLLSQFLFMQHEREELAQEARSYFSGRAREYDFISRALA